MADGANVWLPPRLDLGHPEFAADPYPTYRRLRAEGPLARAGPGTWAVTRYADVAALLKDPRLRNGPPRDYHAVSSGAGETAEFVGRIMLYQDPPRHERIRIAVGHVFDRQGIGAIRERIHAIVESLLAPVAERGAFDAVTELAFPLPIMVICELMGIPIQDRAEVQLRASFLGKAFVPAVQPDDRTIADRAVAWLRSYLERAIADRHKDPRDDVLSLLALAERHDGYPSPADIVDNAVFLFFAGFETTASVLATICAELPKHEDQLARLRADRMQIPVAVEEFLRYDAPIQTRLRFVQQPLEMAGRTIKAGRALLLLLGSANRDERHFDRPDELDLARMPNQHVTFGGGDHYCLGALLARLELGIAIERLLDRFTHLEPLGPPQRRLNSPFRTYERVPLRVRAA